MIRIDPDVVPGVLQITLDRPDRRNAIDHASLVGLLDAQAQAANARVVVITGTPPAFSAGADLSGVRPEVFHDDLSRVLRGFAQLPVPVIAAIDGPALGAGAQIAAVCDLRVATPDSKIGIPAARLGLVVDHWTIDRMTREFTWPVARAMFVAADTYRAQRLYEIGVIHRLGGLDVALDWAHDIAQLAPLAIAGHKLALEASGGQLVRDDQVEAARARAWSSDDADEGRQAFLEKRRARFTGR